MPGRKEGNYIRDHQSRTAQGVAKAREKRGKGRKVIVGTNGFGGKKGGGSESEWD